MLVPEVLGLEPALKVQSLQYANVTFDTLVSTSKSHIKAVPGLLCEPVIPHPFYLSV